MTVIGKVWDSETKAPLTNASVFAEHTTLGTVTDKEGNFSLFLPEGGYDLIVTYTGYAAANRRVTVADHSNLVFEMKLQDKVMQEVAVVATGEVKDGWEKYGSFFLEQFIGKTTNSNNCSILNKDVVHFYFSKRKNRLKIMATEPLLIENKALGYQLKYSLDSFTHEYNSQVSIYTGYPFFEEMKPQSDGQAQQWKAARERAYKGSTLHFMRSLYQRSLQQEGFEIQFVVNINGKDSALKLKNYYDAVNFQLDDSSKTLRILPNQKSLGVIYNPEKPADGYLKENEEEPSAFQFSTLQFQAGQPIHIESNGYYYEQNDLTINGYWTWDKVADALPYDFMPSP
jgi:hypothetical protein